ncbi:MAG: prepilin peptidase [Candidatus Hadarchaeales archaeon]
MNVDFMPVAIAIFVALVSTYTDIRWRIIPNRATYPATAFGIIFHLFLGIYSSNLLLCLRGFIGFGIAFLIGYLLWITGGWAGGDVKLFSAFGALLPSFSPPFAPAPYSSEYPLFALTVLFNTALVAIPVILAYALLSYAKGEGAFYKRCKITDLKEGMIPAEWIVERNGKLFRKSAILSFSGPSGNTYTNPNRASGLTRAQIIRLKRLVSEKRIENEIRVKRVVPFGPFLAAGLLVSVCYGDMYWGILAML